MEIRSAPLPFLSESGQLRTTGQGFAGFSRVRSGSGKTASARSRNQSDSYRARVRTEVIGLDSA